MSKQSGAKYNQGYNPKPILRICSNCIHYRSELTQPYLTGAFPNPFVKEGNIRCNIGYFAIKKTGTCNLIEVKPV